MSAALPHRMSAREYLDWERLQPEKHEYHRGEVFAMAGGSLRHDYLSAATIRELGITIAAHGCGRHMAVPRARQR